MSISKKYRVAVPFVGFYEVDVDAETEMDAKQQALSAGKILSITSDNETLEVMEWESLSYIAKGNACYAPLINMEVTEIEE